MNTTSKSPFILGGCGCLSFIAAMTLFAAAFFATDSSSPIFGGGTAPEELVTYHNTRTGRSGPLADHYVDFEFHYPKSWFVKPQDAGSSNFVSVERAVAGQTHENFNVGYFSTAGDKEQTEAMYPQLIAQLQTQFAQQFNDLKKVSEGPTKVASYEGYEGLFAATTPDGSKRLNVYTKVILLPTPDGKKGVTLVLMGTSLHPDLTTPEDLGHKGELPTVLDSFRFGE